MSEKLFHLSKNNRFGLEYPSLEERWEKFIIYIINRVDELDNYRNYHETCLDDIIKLSKEELYILLDIEFKNGFINLLISLKDENNKNYIYYILDLFLVGCGNFLESPDLYNLYQDDSFLCVNRIIDSFEIFDLEYYWNKEKSRLERKIDEADTLIINDNLKKIDPDLEYSKCVDEFLKPKIEADYLQSLDHLKRVFERVLSQNGIGGGVAKPKAVVNKLFPGKTESDIPGIKDGLEFIKSNIHHDKSIKPKKFSEKEYIYWWLEINKLIFILNSDK